VERDGRWLGIESRGEGVLVERPTGVIDGERAVGERPEASPLFAQLGGSLKRGTEATQCAGLADRCRQLDLVPRAERSNKTGTKMPNRSQKGVRSIRGL
jgi:hypothetical protein